MIESDLLTSEDLFFEKLEEPKKSEIIKARQLADKGEVGPALELLRPFVDKGDPVALYYGSKFSDSSVETLDDYEYRSLEMLKKSAEMGYAPALHQLGVKFDIGDWVIKDTEKAAEFFKKAAYLGHPHSQWIHGLDLVNGKNGIKKNYEEGVRLIKNSAEQGFEGAIETLINWAEAEGLDLFDDPKQLERLRERLQFGNLLEY